ncbi:protein translocase subunit SecF [Frankia nepalensis]|uniref:Protein-export membrane protein SecF n=1 Tax=Frankia nepalensis TaxID=1836974 RepID=A0A937RGV3_9ACTN|nr:protein translocase subunit SecF [Frankia nepalensis]MBL7494749.1 protein translocase subunit SecF [Frankia nepalensis]MBL7514030.1 protein translocase subunit SecF [Frankia nepalensis]MBL7629962.1 protein translocase subunit SecF [Frankia nepalensis]
MSAITRFYRGEFYFDFMSRRKIWYLISGTLLAICVVSMLVRGFSLGIDFKGGAVFQFPANGHSIEDARDVLRDNGINADEAVVQQLETSKQLRVQTEELTEPQTAAITNAVAEDFGVKSEDIAVSTVGASWGETITNKAIQGLVIFLVLVMIYLTIRFEWKMAVAAMAALIHDLVVTLGIYSLVGFEVTPSTIIAILAILGFSLYDTVVVFDRVRENTAGIATSSRRTYAEATNDSLNETLIRSLNTSFIALIPVGSLLFVGAGLLGAGTLRDLALAQFVGIASGAYSSLFFAAPLLVDLKRSEQQVKALDARVNRARASAARVAAAAEAEPALAGASPGAAYAVGGLGDSEGAAAGEREPAPAGASPRRPAARPGQPAGRGRAAPRRGGGHGRPGGRKRR